VELEKRISNAKGEKVVISDLFDLFAGTSTGGILALGFNV